MKFAVIGSGPSALASVWSLLEFNVDITVIDTHITESDKNLHIPSLFIKKFKLIKGSDFPYRHFAFGPEFKTNGMAIPYSFSFGGLSTVWGAAMLPYSSEDTVNWPNYMQDLAKEYNFISSRVPIARLRSEKSKYYEDYSNTDGLMISRKIQTVLEDSKKHPHDFEYNVTSLAVQSDTVNKKGCVYCKKCLEGCPYDFIWSTTKDWEFLRRSKKISFMTGIRVIKVIDSPQGASFMGIDKNGSNFQSEYFDHLVLAAGSIESFRISASSNLCPTSATLKDNKTFLIPFIHKKRVKETSDLGFSLSQAYLRARTNSGAITHLQFYLFSDSVLKKANSENWTARIVPNRLLRFVMKRLIFAIGYLPDESSTSLIMRIDGDGGVLFEKKNDYLEKKFVFSLPSSEYLPESTTFRSAGLLPIRLLIKVLGPGLGAHYGGWAPAGLTTDNCGRFNSNSRIHLVDSSVLPSIPAGPITLTVMANAARIINQLFR